jgi:hypothetical protein
LVDERAVGGGLDLDGVLDDAAEAAAEVLHCGSARSPARGAHPAGTRDRPRASAERTAASRARRVHQAMVALGGISSPAGSCVWHVVGLQRSVREWAIRQGWGGRPVRQEQAQGILIASLGMLAVHLGTASPGWPPERCMCDLGRPLTDRIAEVEIGKGDRCSLPWPCKNASSRTIARKNFSELVPGTRN